MNKPTPPPTVAAHFVGKSPTVRAMYGRLLAALAKVGPVREDPKKTSIHLVRSTALAGVQIRKTHINLTIKADVPWESSRVHKSEQVSAHRFHHETRLSTVKDVDAELRQWLKRAYELSA